MAQIYLTDSMFSLKDFYTFVSLVHSVKQILPRKYLIALSSYNTGLSKKMDGIWNRYNLKSPGRIYTFSVLKCSEKFKVLDLP